MSAIEKIDTKIIIEDEKTIKYIRPILSETHYGTQLMQSAEKFALDKGCSFLAVNTMDWEALDFYKKLGYFVEFERHGFEKNSIFYFLRKNLK